VAAQAGRVHVDPTKWPRGGRSDRARAPAAAA
jgi:hypothetical protein